MQERDSDAANVTELLQLWKGGDASAADRVVPLIYAELKKLASSYLRLERRAGTLQTTALVHEAYLRLAQGNVPDWENRIHFFGIAARLMRQILVDHARARTRQRRGGGAVPVVLDEGLAVSDDNCWRILEIDDALKRLADIDERKARVVELRWFGGMEVDEVAKVLDISPITVVRDWAFARAWLEKALGSRASSA